MGFFLWVRLGRRSHQTNAQLVLAWYNAQLFETDQATIVITSFLRHEVGTWSWLTCDIYFCSNSPDVILMPLKAIHRRSRGTWPSWSPSFCYHHRSCYQIRNCVSFVVIIIQFPKLHLPIFTGIDLDESGDLTPASFFEYILRHIRPRSSDHIHQRWSYCLSYGVLVRRIFIYGTALSSARLFYILRVFDC